MTRRIARRWATFGAAACLSLVAVFAQADQNATKFGMQASSPPGGRRQYSPVRITKLVDAASPQLLQALITNEALKRVTVDFIAANGGLARNVILQNARVISIDQYTEADPAGGIRAVEDVSISFARIEVNDMAGRTTTADDVQTRT